MMFRSKKVAGIALAAASITALAACSSGGSGGGGNNNNGSSSVVKVPGGIGSIPVAPAGETVAVRVSGPPMIAGFTEDEIVTVGVTLPTTWVRTSEPPLRKWLSPEYTAAIW